MKQNTANLNREQEGGIIEVMQDKTKQSLHPLHWQKIAAEGDMDH